MKSPLPCEKPWEAQFCLGCGSCSCSSQSNTTKPCPLKKLRLQGAELRSLMVAHKERLLPWLQQPKEERLLAAVAGPAPGCEAFHQFQTRITLVVRVYVHANSNQRCGAASASRYGCFDVFTAPWVVMFAGGSGHIAWDWMNNPKKSISFTSHRSIAHNQTRQQFHSRSYKRVHSHVKQYKRVVFTARWTGKSRRPAGRLHTRRKTRKRYTKRQYWLSGRGHPAYKKPQPRRRRLSHTRCIIIPDRIDRLISNPLAATWTPPHGSRGTGL